MKNVFLLLLITFATVGCDRSNSSTATVEPVAVVESIKAVDSEKQTVPVEPQESAAPAIRILAWNIESEGANIDVIADELLAMDRYDLYGFTEVRPQEWGAIKDALGDGFVFWYSKTGYNDRTAYAISKERFEVIKKYELGKFGDIVINPGNYRSPHVYELRDRQTDIKFATVLNHLARGKAEIRQKQAEGLRQWAASMTLPVIAIGDYNFDYVFETEKGNPAFDIFMSDDTFVWVKPEPLIDSNWFDGNGDGEDDYPGSILDFAFVAGEAKRWNPISKVIVREGDFPDDDQTSDHRPIELVITPTE
ncbi:Endonuclease/Exonuclease/phosphatase family protein [Rubripirellula obstinata]|uniref:Endonuclease/Exonuclease/phosphatase family protein n=1 Tax=Rubripirellula obstinata TaxID=406547 RepID=A0A5B1CF15_9BACT|nr:hypothetical protein [Rubripirellula obstinata]KAA1258475.1 Endonuclease/Exonuclease/phosphatase family protein [Rubripirellula obstinata]